VPLAALAALPLLFADAPPAESPEPVEPVEQEEGMEPAVPPDGTNATETAVRRDPFWPVGYVPLAARPPVTNEAPVVVEPEKVEEEPAPVIKWPELYARGLTQTPEKDYIAFLDGIGMIEEGDSVRVVRDSTVFTWRVDRITKDGAKLRRVSAVAKKPR